MERRGLSPIIAVVLLLMITVTIGVLVASFVIPFVKNNLQQGEECFDALGDIEFAETEYNCYYDETIQSGGAESDNTGFSVKVNDEGLEGFSVALYYQGSSQSFDVKNETQTAGLKVLLTGPNLIVPKRGETRTYVAGGVFTKVELYPILIGGRRCDIADEITLPACIDQQVIDDLKA